MSDQEIADAIFIQNNFYNPLHTEDFTIKLGRNLIKSENNITKALGFWLLGHVKEYYSRIDDVSIYGCEDTKLQFFLESAKYDPNNPHVFYSLAMTCAYYKKYFITLHDKRTFYIQQLYLEAIKLGSTNPSVYIELAYSLPYSLSTIMLHDKRHMNRFDLMIESLKFKFDLHIIHSIQKTINYSWSRENHSLGLFYNVNKLFGTLFLGIQALEDKGILQLAHQAMFEDMLSLFWMNLWKERDRELSLN